MFIDKKKKVYLYSFTANPAHPLEKRGTAGALKYKGRVKGRKGRSELAPGRGAWVGALAC